MWHPRTTYFAARYGYFECLKYAHENGCPWVSTAIYWAACNEYFECLKYAHENGCGWDSAATWGAAYNGHLECLMYIYEKCGDVATWKKAKLKKDFYEFSREIQNFINSVREDWKHGLNRPGMGLKSAKIN